MRYSSRRRPGQEDPEPFKKVLTLDGAVEVFINGKIASGHTERTIRNNRRTMRLFMGYIRNECGHVNIVDIDEPDILAWIVHLRTAINVRGTLYNSRSIQAYCREVMAFFRWLFKHDYISVDPVENIDLPKAEKVLIRVFTEDELKLLDIACVRTTEGGSTTPDERKALAARDRSILWLLLSTGIRASELCGLLLSDIDWDAGMIYVRGKGAKERKVPMGKVARQHLTTYIQYWRGVPAIDDDEHVYLAVFGTPMAKETLTRVFARLKRVAGIDDKRVSAHTCRHWFAVNSIKNGMPSTVLQSFLGHEHLEMINVYVHLAEQDNRSLYDRFSPVDALEMHNTPKSSRERSREWRKDARKKKS